MRERLGSVGDVALCVVVVLFVVVLLYLPTLNAKVRSGISGYMPKVSEEQLTVTRAEFKDAQPGDAVQVDNLVAIIRGIEKDRTLVLNVTFKMISGKLYVADGYHIIGPWQTIEQLASVHAKLVKNADAPEFNMIAREILKPARIQ